MNKNNFFPSGCQSPNPFFGDDYIYWYMKYIISEHQKKVIHVLRRVEEDFNWIRDIVDEGVDMDLCQIDDFDEYFKQVVNGSAMTYLFNYFDNHLEEGYKEMEKYMIDYIKKNFTRRITHHWKDNKEDC